MLATSFRQFLLGSFLFLIGICSTSCQGNSTSKNETSSEDAFVIQLFRSIMGREVSIEKKELIAPKAKRLYAYGWHPSWLGSDFKNYDFDHLTTVAYNSFEISLDKGKFSFEEHNWGSKAVKKMIETAHSSNCTVELTFKCHQRAAIKHLLDDDDARLTCLSYLDQLVNDIQIADGINIVFEDVPQNYSQKLFWFTQQLAAILHEEGKSLTMALPPEDFGNKFPIDSLATCVDRFIIMGYNYYHSGSSTAGPIAPLESGDKWDPFNLKRSVDTYLQRGIPHNKIILALPLYGGIWEKQETDQFVEHIRYNKVDQLIRRKDLSIQYDSISSSAFVNYSTNDRDYQCWFDNSETLNKKISWAWDKGLGGFGFWALGYAEGNNSFWEIPASYPILKDPFIGDDIPVDSTLLASFKATYSENSDQIDVEGKANAFIAHTKDVIDQMLKNKYVLLVGSISLLIFGLLGVFGSLFSTQIREKFIIENFSTYLFVNAIFSIIVITLYFILGFWTEARVLEGHTVETNGRFTLFLFAFLIWMIINTLSWRLIARFNKDVP